jgi:hypothetical protein
MADGQFGGNGSVHWFVNADEASDVKSNGTSGKPWKQSGIDYHGNGSALKNFTIRIRLPRPADRENWWAQLSAAIAKVAGSNQPGVFLEFTLPIEKGGPFVQQIQVQWGATDGAGSTPGGGLTTSV